MKRRKKKQNNDVIVNVDAFDGRAVTDSQPAEPAPAPEVPKGRQLIVVDLETTGLHDDAAILEVAAVNVDTGDTLHFVPHVTPDALGNAEPKAMQVNRYYERGLFEQALPPRQTSAEYLKLREMLVGNTFAGSNPAFDSRLLAGVKLQRELPTSGYPWDYPSNPRIGRVADSTYAFGRPWHRRLADLAAYAAGKLDIDLDDLPGLDAVAERLDVAVLDRHTAMGDAVATAHCFEILRSTRRCGSWSSSRYLSESDALLAQMRAVYTL